MSEPLEDYLLNRDSPERAGPEAREAFRVTDDGKAVWAMRLLRTIHQKRDALRAQAAREIEAVQEWLALQEGPLDADERWATLLLEDYARAQRAAGRKSITLSTGTISTRRTGGGLVVDDPAFLEWCKMTHPEWVTTEIIDKRPSIADLKAALTVADGVVLDTGGEIVPGITVSPTGVGVSLKPND